MITFSIIAHNEGSTIANIVRHALAARRPGDHVLVADSASTDGTAENARAAGADVISAPLGKGRAMAAVVAEAHSPWICFLDGDVPEGNQNFAAELRAHIENGTADHILGEFEDVSRSPLSNTVAVYEPMTRCLFPEANGFGTKPLTGFRAVRSEYLRPDEFPPGFGIEAYLNLSVLLAGGSHRTVPIGPYRGPFKYKQAMGTEIGDAVLDVAERHGRLSGAARPSWDEWVATAVTAISGYHGTEAERPAFMRVLADLVRRPCPPTR